MTAKTSSAIQNAVAKSQTQAQAQVPAATTPKATLTATINKMLPAIKAALPSVMTPERFTRIALSAISVNPKLTLCTQQSFLGAMMTAAQLGLECNTPLGQAYLIPRYGNVKDAQGNWHKEWQCTFQLGYKGLIDLCYRSGEISTISAHTVYSNDTFEYELGLDAKLIHKPAMAGRGEPIAFYGVYRTKDGGYGFEVLSVEDARQHAQKYSEAVKNGHSSPWDTNFEEMAKKTVIKKLLKYAPIKTEFARQIAQDDTVHQEITEDMLDTAEFIQTEGTITDPEPTAEQAIDEGTGHEAAESR